MVARPTLLAAALALAYILVFFKLYDIQIMRGAGFRARAESQYAAANLSRAERGLILFTDKNGGYLQAAGNKNFPIIYAVPKMIEDTQEAANQLAPILNEPAAGLQDRLAEPGAAYKLLRRKADKETAARIAELNLKGVYIELSPERFYPLGKRAAHLVGFVGPNETDFGEQGKYGVEEFYNSALAGTPGSQEDGAFRLPAFGKNLILTIDPSVQAEAERILEELVMKHRATGGSVIVEEPRTGKILAMGSYPTFDPNRYSEAELGDFLNPVTQQIYEPGSVFKIITMAAGIDAGKIATSTTFNDTGVLILNGKKIQNWDHKAYGRVTMTNVIEKSLNTGAAFAERTTGDKIFTDYVTKFGFGEPTGVDLPYELKGDLRRLNPSSPAIAFATASFGQGVAVTQMGLINAVAAIANDGELMRPYVNADLAPHSVRTVITKKTADAVTEMMVSAVDKADVASISGYSIAGKTGTAQVPDFVHGGYTDKVINTYVGFGPTSNPRFAILIKLNEPEGAPVAGLTVVPAFRDLAQFILNYFNIPPDRLGSTP